MIIVPKKPIHDAKTQISNIWTGFPNIRAVPACSQISPKPAPNLVNLLPEFHAHLLDVVRTLIDQHKCAIPKFQDNTSTLLKILFDEKLPSPSTPTTAPLSSLHITLTTDAWAFGSFWPYIQEICETSESLYENIGRRRVEIQEIREGMRSKIIPIPGIQELLDAGNLSLNCDGISGSYVLSDVEGVPHFIIKPLDEDIGAINNPKGYASPFIDSPVRVGVPVYRSPFREVGAFDIASMIGVSSIVPRTSFAILQNDRFFDLSENVRPNEMQRYFEHVGYPDKEKLCSVQEYVLESKTLLEASQDLQSLGLLDEEIEQLLDQHDFEDANILLWVTGDTDGHFGNFLVTPKRIDAIGNQIFGLKKIDNALAFPEINGQLINSLVHLPNARRPLSKSAIEKIEALDPNAIENILSHHGLEGSNVAMRERIEALQSIVRQDPTKPIKSINKKLSKIHEKLA